MADPTSAATLSNPGHACQVFLAADFYVSHGTNHGDALGLPDEVDPGDIYRLEREARPRRLVVTQPREGAQFIASGSEVGQPDQPVRLVARYALMAPDGDKVELLLLALPDGTGFVLPLSPVGPGVEYALVAVEAAPADLHLADILCLSFALGTMITLGDGSQRAVEQLRPGDAILTRDHGRQPIRWIGHARLRAVGAFAPVVIPAGTLGNSGDLVLSQHHRVFLYQRQKLAGLATAELLVQARHFVDEDRIFLREGGFVDYYALIFDRHEIIYAEGIPSESLMVNDATVNRLPPEIAAEVKSAFPGLSHIPHFGTEAGRQFLEEIGPKTLLRGRGGR